MHARELNTLQAELQTVNERVAAATSAARDARKRQVSAEEALQQRVRDCTLLEGELKDMAATVADQEGVIRDLVQECGRIEEIEARSNHLEDAFKVRPLGILFMKSDVSLGDTA